MLSSNTKSIKQAFIEYIHERGGMRSAKNYQVLFLPWMSLFLILSFGTHTWEWTSVSEWLGEWALLRHPGWEPQLWNLLTPWCDLGPVTCPLLGEWVNVCKELCDNIWKTVACHWMAVNSSNFVLENTTIAGFQLKPSSSIPSTTEARSPVVLSCSSLLVTRYYGLHQMSPEFSLLLQSHSPS